MAEGLQVVAVAAEADADLLRSLGAHVFVPRGPDIADRVLKELGVPVNAVADGAVAAHARLGRGGLRERIVLRFDDETWQPGSSETAELK